MPPSEKTFSTDRLRSALAGKNIGLSISDSADRASWGFDNIHQKSYMYEIARALYRCGASISYGGHLKGEGFTSEGLRFLIDEQQAAIKGQAIYSYVPWPLNRLRPEKGHQSQLEEDFRAFAKFPPLDPPAEFKGDAEEFLKPVGDENRYFWFRSLTGMRQRMNAEIQGRIVLGGQQDGFKGRYPGIFEEVLLAVAAGKPVYICGGFGGAAHALGRLFSGNRDPELDSPPFLSGKEYTENVSYYEKKVAREFQGLLAGMSPFGRFLDYAVDYPLLCEFFRTLKTTGLNNGLSHKENRILFETGSLDEIRMLVLAGLSRLAGGSELPELGMEPEAAFEEALKKLEGKSPRDGLIEDFEGLAKEPDEVIEPTRPIEPNPIHKTPVSLPKSQISGSEMGKLSAAIQSSFSDPYELDRVLTFKLEDPIIRHQPAGAKFPATILEIIRDYSNRFKIGQLVNALLEENPTNEHLLKFVLRHQFITTSTTDSGKLLTGGAALERMLAPGRGFTDVGEFLPRLNQVVNWVCQIRYPVAGKTQFGTGFLIGKDTVLTNWHVIEHVTNHNRGKLRLTFDYRSGPGGSEIVDGTPFELVDGDDWLIANSPYDEPADTMVQDIHTDRETPRKAGFFDYAVLRLKGDPGTNPIGKTASPGAPPRGFLDIRKAAEVPEEGSGVWCFQHPYQNKKSLPLQVDWNSAGLLGTNTDESRVWYHLNTLPGSSGSPVLNDQLEVFALHHAGGQDWPAPDKFLYNRGIPLSAICEHLGEKLSEIY